MYLDHWSPNQHCSHPFHSSCSPRPFKIIHGAVICSDRIQPENALKTMIKCDNMVTSEWHSIALLSLPTGKVSGNSSKDRLMDRSCCLIVFCAAWGSLWRAMEFHIGPTFQVQHLGRSTPWNPWRHMGNIFFDAKRRTNEIEPTAVLDLLH